jgi:hypothetical protein
MAAGTDEDETAVKSPDIPKYEEEEEVNCQRKEEGGENIALQKFSDTFFSRKNPRQKGWRVVACVKPAL